MRILQAALCLCLLCCSFATAQGQNTRHVDSLLRALRNAGRDTVKADILLTLSHAYRPDGVTQQFYYANEALALSEKAGWDKGRMYAEQLIADCYNKINAFSDAIAHFRSSLAAAKKIDDRNIEAYCLQLLFHCYYHIDSLPQALAAQGELVALVEREGEARKICDQRSAYVTCLSDNGRYDEAIAYMRKNIAFAEAKFRGDEQVNMVANMLNIQALTYIKMKNWDSARHCLRTAASMLQQIGDYSSTTYLNSSFCDLYVANGNRDSAIIYGELAVKMGAVINDIKLQQAYSKTLSELYEAAQKPAPALFYYKMSDSLIRIIDSAQKNTERAIEMARISLEQMAGRNKLEKKSFEAIRQNQKAALVAVLFAMLALVALTIFIYRNLRQKQKANKTISLQAASLQEQNTIIDRSLKEKEMLLKETHHRVKNNLQLISSLLELQAAGLEDENAKKALRTAQDRVLSIATVHSKLYGNSEDESIEFSAFVSELFTRLNSAFAGEGKVAQFEHAIPNTLLPLNTVVLLGLILNELITNSFKHAFTGVKGVIIRISLECGEGICTLHYYDSGPGLPEGRFEAESGSLGLYIVRRLGKQLKGTVAYKFEAGSIFTINFPYAGN